MIDLQIYKEEVYGTAHNRERVSVTTREHVTWDTGDAIKELVVVIKGTTDIGINTSAGIAITFNAADATVANNRLGGVDTIGADARRYIIPMVVGTARFTFVDESVIRADFKSLNTESLHVWIDAT